MGTAYVSRPMFSSITVEAPVLVERDCNTCLWHVQAAPLKDESPCIVCLMSKRLPEWAPLEPHWFSQ